MNPFNTNAFAEKTAPFSADAVLREDAPVAYGQVEQLLQNAPSLTQNCPTVPLVMEDL